MKKLTSYILPLITLMIMMALPEQTRRAIHQKP
jgi:hypothetical protein